VNHPHPADNPLGRRFRTFSGRIQEPQAFKADSIPEAESGIRTPSNHPQGDPMPKYVIEREIPGAGKLTPAELKAISQKSCGVLSSLGPSIQWLHSYVTGDRIYCIYLANDESLVRRHAELGGFPANKISRVTSIIDPSTAE
jgi:hypothetical protein